MTTRHGLITPSDFWRIQGVDDVLNMPMIVDVLPRISTFNVFYSSMLQAGIDKIELPFCEKEQDSVAPFIRKRLLVRSGAEWVQSFFTVHEFFADHIPSFASEKNHDSDVLDLYTFLIDLLYALSSGRNLLNAKRFPDQSKLLGKLPPEVLIPIRNLLDTFERINPTSLYPRMTIDQDNVALFQEIIMSQRFNEYKSAHSSLEDPSLPTNVSSRHVSQATKSMSSKTKRWLKGRKALVSVLPFSARIVDMIFGALPGKLAEQFARMTQDWLTRNQRLVVYQMDDISRQLIKGRLGEFHRNKVTPPL